MFMSCEGQLGQRVTFLPTVYIGYMIITFDVFFSHKTKALKIFKLVNTVLLIIKITFKAYLTVSFPFFSLTLVTSGGATGGGGGRGAIAPPPPYDFEGEKGEEGKRRKGRRKKERKRRGKEKKRKKGRKKTNKQKNKKPGYGILRGKITPFSYTNFSKILPIGWVPARSLRSLALTHCWQILSAPLGLLLAQLRGTSTHAPSSPLIGVKATLKGGVEGWYIMPLHGITYPLIMAINVQENDVFTVHEFSKSPSLPSPARSFII